MLREGRVILLDRIDVKESNDFNSAQFSSQFAALIALPDGNTASYTIAIGSTRTTLLSSMKIDPTVGCFLNLSKDCGNELTLACGHKSITLRFSGRERFARWYNELSSSLADLIVADADSETSKTNIELALVKLQSLVTNDSTHMLQVKKLLQTKLSQSVKNLQSCNSQSEMVLKTRASPKRLSPKISKQTMKSDDENTAPLNVLSPSFKKSTNEVVSHQIVSPIISVESSELARSNVENTAVNTKKVQSIQNNFSVWRLVSFALVFVCLMIFSLSHFQSNLKASEIESSNFIDPVILQEQPAFEIKSTENLVSIETVRIEYLKALEEFTAHGEVAARDEQTAIDEPSIELVITIGRPPKLSQSIKQSKNRFRSGFHKLVSILVSGVTFIARTAVDLFVPQLTNVDNFDENL